MPEQRFLNLEPGPRGGVHRQFERGFPARVGGVGVVMAMAAREHRAGVDDKDVQDQRPRAGNR